MSASKEPFHYILTIVFYQSNLARLGLVGIYN